MRYSFLAIMFVFITVNAGAIQTEILDLATSGGSADQTVTIIRSDSDEMVMADGDTGTTYSLAELAAGGVTDHGSLTGLADDDHGDSSSEYRYHDWERFNKRLGIGYSTVGTSVTTGTSLIKWLPISTDPSGNTTLGNHTTDTTIHYYRPGGVVTVSKSYTGRAGQYSTIQGAIDAITDSGAAKPYVVLIYPGTYSETVSLAADYVSLI